MSLASQSCPHLAISSNTNKATVIKEIHLSNSKVHLELLEIEEHKKEIEVINLDDDDDDDNFRQLSANSEDSALGLDSYQELPVFQSKIPCSEHHLPSYQSVGCRRDDFRAHLVSQRMIHAADTSSVINSSISTSLPLPKNINSSNTDNVMPFEMSAKFSDSPFKYDNLRNVDHSNEEIAEEWTKKSDTAISYLKKSISSSSSSTSSGCSSDIELANSPIDDHNHHDTAPDSPDSGVSGSLNSPDDLKHVDDEEDNENIDCPINQSNGTSLEILNYDYSEFNSINKSGDETKRTESTCSDDLMHSDLLGVASKLSITAKNLSTQLHCKWRDCDWPGSYEELAEHVREIHVELQPFLDPISGKLIKWSKQKCRDKNAIEEEEDDSISNASENEENEENEEEDDEVEPMDPDDDSQSVGSNSSCRVTRRSNRVQGLFDYSQSNSRSYKLRQSSRLNDQRISSEKPSENQFVCLWKGCKVYGKPSSSRQFLERHVLELHSGPKPFKCIVDRCGQRFKSQTSLQRHVNTHFNGTSVANYMSTLINSTTVQAINSKNTDKRHSEDNCCCRCTCHGCLVCDKSTKGDDKPAIRIDKNRCSSTDSAISFNSSDGLLSPSGTQTKSLSKSPHSSNATTEHCQVNCCMSASKPRSDNLATILLQKSKVSKNKKSAPSIRPNVKGWSQFDFYDQCSANAVIYQIRSQQTANLKLSHSYITIGHMSKGKLVKSDNNDSVLSNEPNEQSNLYEGEYSNVTSIPKVKPKIVERFQSKLFRDNQTEGNLVFSSEVVGACHSNGEEKIRLRWHPLGFLPDTWVKKDELKSHRSRSVPFTELPEQFRKFFNISRSQTKCSKPSSRKRKLTK